MNGKPTIVSLFAGCSGSSLGYQMAGFKELLAIEWDNNAVEIFKLNFPEVPIWQKDISKIKGQEILEFLNIQKNDLDVLDGSPPCQGFSTVGKQQVQDKRNDLFNENIRLINELKPKVFVIENVSGMIKGKVKGLFKEYIKQLKKMPYNVKCKLMNSMWYGIPQSRERLIFIGVKEDIGEPIYPKRQSKIITVRDAIGHLPEGLIGRHSLQLIKAWHRAGSNYSSRKVSGFTSLRLNPNKPSPTQTASGRHWHYKIPRKINIKEAAIIQSFPDNYRWVGSKTKINRCIGNSVPPLMMKAIAKTIKNEILN